MYITIILLISFTNNFIVIISIFDKGCIHNAKFLIQEK